MTEILAIDGPEVNVSDNGRHGEKTTFRSQDGVVYNFPEVFDQAYPGYPGDVEYYKKVVTEDQVEEGVYLGTGTGRIFGPVFHANKEITGIDNCRRMIEALFRRFPEIPRHQIDEADIRTHRLPRESHDRIIAPYSFLTHFTDPEISQILHNIRKSLRRNGEFVTDIFNPYLNPGSKQPREIENMRLEDGGTVSIAREYDHAMQTVSELATVKRGKEVFSVPLKLNYYNYKEICNLIRDAGLGIKSFHGDFDETAFDAGKSPVMLVRVYKPSNTAYSDNVKVSESGN